MQSPWKTIRWRLEWIGVLAMARLFPLLPRRLILLMSNVLGRVAYHLDSRGRATAHQNLEAVYRGEKPGEEIRRIALRSYQSLARTVCDQFWTARLDKENFFDYCLVEHDEPGIMESARETGAIWVTPHYGNFEWISLCAGFLGFSFCVVAQEFKNPLLTRFFTQNREHTGHLVIPQRKSMLRLFKHLKQKGHAAFLTDLSVEPSKAAAVIDCMGFKTCVTGLHAELMKRTHLPVIPGICIPRPDGTYVMHGFRSLKIRPADTSHQIAQECWNVFEPYILAHPEHWIWMYKHWRFHPDNDSEAYPPYANPDYRFQAIIWEQTQNESSKV